VLVGSVAGLQGSAQAVEQVQAALAAGAIVHIIADVGYRSVSNISKEGLQQLADSERAALSAAWVQRLLYHPSYVSALAKNECKLTQHAVVNALATNACMHRCMQIACLKGLSFPPHSAPPACLLLLPSLFAIVGGGAVVTLNNCLPARFVVCLQFEAVLAALAARLGGPDRSLGFGLSERARPYILAAGA
jgi:hypothetical protein